MGTQPGTTIEDVVDRFILTNKVDAACIAVEAALTHEDGDDADFAGSHADLGKRDLRTVGEATQVFKPIGDIGLTLENLIVEDGDIPPRLGVDDDHTGRTDDHEVDVCPLRTGPQPVGEDVKTLALKELEQLPET